MVVGQEIVVQQENNSFSPFLSPKNTSLQNLCFLAPGHCIYRNYFFSFYFVFVLSFTKRLKNPLITFMSCSKSKETKQEFLLMCHYFTKIDPYLAVSPSLSSQCMVQTKKQSCQHCVLRLSQMNQGQTNMLYCP